MANHDTAKKILKCTGYLDIFYYIYKLFVPYQYDKQITKGNIWQQATSILPILNVPIHLFRGLLVAPLVLMVAFPLLCIPAFFVISLGILGWVFSPIPSNNPIVVFLALACKALALLATPVILLLPVIGAAAAFVLGTGIAAVTAVGEVAAAAVATVATPISLVTRGTLSIGCCIVKTLSWIVPEILYFAMDVLKAVGKGIGFLLEKTIQAGKFIGNSVVKLFSKKKVPRTADVNNVEEKMINRAELPQRAVAPKEKPAADANKIVWGPMFSKQAELDDGPGLQSIANKTEQLPIVPIK